MGQDFNQTSDHHKFARPIKAVVLFSLFRATFPQQAHAYLDLGTGSYFTQLILASLLGGLLALKAYWQKVRQFVTSFFTKKPAHEKPKT